MENVYRYVFSKNKDLSRELRNYLDSKRIKYKEGPILLSFTIGQENKNWEKIDNIVARINGSAEIEVVFSREELSKIDYFALFTKKVLGYPQPEYDDPKGDFIDFSFDKETWCSICGSNRNQKSPILLKKKDIPIDQFFFSGIHWINDIKFVNDYTASIISRDLSGASFSSVSYYKGRDKFENLLQLNIKNLFPARFKFDKAKEYICPNCQTKKYISLMGTNYYYPKELKLDKDFYLSEEIFGEGLFSDRFIIVSRKMKELVESYKFRHIIFRPILAE